MKAVVVFQGGGSLGAFAAGAWQTVSRSWARDDTLIAVAGSSIGAVTAATIAHSHGAADRGAQALTALWQERLKTPPWPFAGPLPMPVPPSGGASPQWNGVLTGLLLGTRGLHRAHWPAWQPATGLSRLQRPLHDRGPMWQLLEQAYPPLSTADTSAPLLAVSTVDVMAGTLLLYDSDTVAVGPRHLAASSAIPLVFEPVELDGRLCWDGDVTRDSMLPPLFERLLQTGRLRHDEGFKLITVEQFTRPIAAVPASGLEIAYRAVALLQVDKMVPPAMPGVRVARWIRIMRDPLPEDGVSGQFDYSPDRIERLLDQGRRAASHALAA
jgi:NTE family protein